MIFLLLYVIIYNVRAYNSKKRKIWDEIATVKTRSFSEIIFDRIAEYMFENKKRKL